MAKLKWFGRERQNEIRQKAGGVIHELATDLATQTKTNISEQAPPHSRPGEFPKRISGSLLQSVEVQSDIPAMTSIVGTNAEHAPHVEDSRPFLVRTLEAMRIRLRKRALELAGKGSR